MSNLEFYPSLFRYLTIVLGIIVMVWALFKRPSLSSGLTMVICVIVAIIIGLIPEDSAVCFRDRPRYLYLFLIGEDRTSITDVGFLMYVRLCRFFLGGNYKLFFILSALFYVMGYYVFSRSVSPNDGFAVLIVSCFLAMGFLNYGVNTMRSGMALSTFLIGYSADLRGKRIWSRVFMVLSFLVHISLILPVVAFFLSKTKITLYWYYLFWVVMLLVTIINVVEPLVSIVESLSVDKLVNYMEDEESAYNTGFRIDFVLYSVFPIFAGHYYINMKKYKNPVYIEILKQYIFINAIWLLFIRMQYTDRFAYLSWFLIPFVLMVPALDKRIDRRYISAVLLFFVLFKFLR